MYKLRKLFLILVKGFFAKVVKFPFEYLKFSKLKDNRFVFSAGNLYPCLFDETEYTGFDRHYVYHTAWAARKLNEYKPNKHIDISSSLFFVGIASAFVDIDFYDYRPAKLYLDGLNAKGGDISSLPFADNSIESLSCMHVIEHIGLGRYGDPIDPIADQKAFKELSRVLAPGGHLLFVTPIGATAKIAFNAHRIYTKDLVEKELKDLQLLEFSLIPENENDGGIITWPSSEILAKQTYACGCFLFTKSK